MDTQTIQLIGVVLTSLGGKYVVDAARAILAKVKLPLGAWGVRWLTAPIALGLTYLYDLVTHTPFDISQVNTLLDALLAAAGSSYVHDIHSDIQGMIASTKGIRPRTVSPASVSADRPSDPGK
jgi:hypothetical protein